MNKQEQNIREFISQYTGTMIHVADQYYKIEIIEEFKDIKVRLLLLGCTYDEGGLHYDGDLVLSEDNSPVFAGKLMQLVDYDYE